MVGRPGHGQVARAMLTHRAEERRISDQGLRYSLRAMHVCDILLWCISQRPASSSAERHWNSMAGRTGRDLPLQAGLAVISAGVRPYMMAQAGELLKFILLPQYHILARQEAYSTQIVGSPTSSCYNHRRVRMTRKSCIFCIFCMRCSTTFSIHCTHIPNPPIGSSSSPALPARPALTLPA